MAEPSARAPGPAASPFLSLAMLLVAMVSVQVGATFAKRLFPAIGAEGTAGLRLLLSALILAVIRRPWRGAWPDRASLFVLVVYGVAMGSMNMLFYMALRTVPLGIAVALELVGPLTVAVLGSRRRSHFGWLALAVAGLALLFPWGGWNHAVDPRGALFAMAAGGCWGLYILFGRRTGQAFGSRGVALGMAIGAAVWFPVGFAHAGMALFTPGVLLLGLVVAALSSVIPYSLEMIALTRVPARAFGALMSLEPAIAAAAGFVFLRQALSPLQWLAILIVGAASIGITHASRADA